MEISLSLSGGGYRASAYHLGVLHYLNRLVLQDDKKLLDEVNIISGISGGALTALWYVKNEVKGKSRDIVFREFYHLLDETNIAQEILENNFKEKDPQCQFTKLLSEAYDKIFFNGELFGEILDSIANNHHIHHFSIDATDFNSGLPFRFQATHKMSGANPYGFIGNNLCNLPRDLARTIKLADIMAASSCFPVAFDPLVIDNSYNEDFRNSTFLISHKPIVLMDGGIIDNLGIDPIERAAEQMQTQSKEIDLMILSDVSQKDFPPYTPSEIKFCDFPIEKVFSIHKRIITGIFIATIVLFILGIVLIIQGNSWYKFVFGLSIPCGIVFFLDKYIRHVIRFREFPYKGITIPTKNFKKVSIQSLTRLTLNRLKSAYMMANNITMSHIRRKFLNSLFADEKKKEKTILNAQYTLTSTGNWKNRMMRYAFLPKVMAPSQELHNITDEAYSQPTTLWFTDKQKKDNVLDKLVACGQYTTCWNLLLYILKMENRKEEDHGRTHSLLHIKKQLMDDWRKFNNDPLFMVNRIK